MAFYDSGDALYGTGAYGSASYGIVTPTVALTGVSGTALTRTVHINAFEIDITEPLYGPNALVGSVGTLEFANTVTLATTVGTGQIGTVSPNIAFGIVGVGGTTGTGLTQPQHRLSEKVDSVSATFTIGTLNIRSVNRVPVTMPAMSGLITAPEPRVDEIITTGVEATGQIGTVSPNTAAGVTGVEGELNPLRPFTASGDAQLSTAEKKFGTASLLLDGTGDFVTTSYTSSLLTSTQWTVDFWVYSSTLTSQTAHLWDGQNSNSGFALRIVNGTLQVIKDNSIIRSVT